MAESSFGTLLVNRYFAGHSKRVGEFGFTYFNNNNNKRQNIFNSNLLLPLPAMQTDMEQILLIS